MAFNDLDRKRIENAMANFLAKRRPPPHIRPELDIGYRLQEQSVEILEIRPQWDDPSIIHQYEDRFFSTSGMNIFSMAALTKRG